MNETLAKEVMFIRPNDVLFSYDLIIIDIYNQLRHKLKEVDKEAFRVKIESTFNENLYMYSIDYDDKGNMFFRSDIDKRRVDIEDYNVVIASKKHSFISYDVWVWLYETPYANIVYEVAISFFNYSMMDIEDGFNMFIITADHVVPETYDIGRFFRNKNKVETKVIDMKKLSAWFKYQFKDVTNGVMNTIWLAEDFSDPIAIMMIAQENEPLEDDILRRIMLETRIVPINEANMKRAEELSKEERVSGNIGVIDTFKISKIDQLL